MSREVWQQFKPHGCRCWFREIARNIGLPAGTVLATAKREGWTQQIREAKQMCDPQTLSITPVQP